jgi:hypothetical protein
MQLLHPNKEKYTTLRFIYIVYFSLRIVVYSFRKKIVSRLKNPFLLFFFKLIRTCILLSPRWFNVIVMCTLTSIKKRYRFLHMCGTQPYAFDSPKSSDPVFFEHNAQNWTACMSLVGKCATACLT